MDKPVALSNKGGIITILDETGLKVDGVSYTKAQASNPGLDHSVLIFSS